MSDGEIRVIGIDTSLRSTGVGVVAASGNRFSAVESCAFKVPSRARRSACLLRIREGLIEVIERTRPSVAAIEGVFFSRNVSTSVILGEARGAAISACAEKGLPVYEYAPRKVKQAVVGHGGAEKEQIRRMVMTLLSLNEEPGEDAGDALAIAICHLHSRSGVAALLPEPL